MVSVFAAILLAGAVLAKEAEQAKPDPRLDQKVTYQAKGQVLQKVLAELSSKTGVVMLCGRSSRDWQVRDRKVTVFVKDFPFKDVQSALADILHFTWAHGTKDGALVYRIFQDLKSRKEEERLRRDSAEQENRRQAEKQESAIAEFEKLASLTPEELEKLKADSPQSYLVAKEPFFGAMGRLIQASPELRQALAERRKLTIDLSAASPEAVRAAREFASTYTAFMQRVASVGEEFASPADHIDQAMITVNADLPDVGRGDPFENMFLGMVAISAEDCETADMPLFDLNGPFGKLIGEMLTKFEQGMTPEQLDAEMEPMFEEMVLDIMRQDEPPEPLPDDPDLEKTVKIEISQSQSLPDVLEELAEKAELQVVSDHFLQRPGMMPPMVKPGDKVGALLRSIALAHGKRVKKSGKLVTFEDRKWFEKRSWEVPEEWIERWSAKAEKETLTLGDLVDIAGLTDEQIDNTIAVDDRLRAVWPARVYRDVLRLYAALGEAQKQALRSSDGLDLSTLAPEQQPYLARVLPDSEGTKTEQRKQLAMFLEEGQRGKEYTFRLVDLSPAPDEEEPTGSIGEWPIYLPGYKPPPQEKPAPTDQAPTQDEVPEPPEPGPE